MRTVVTVLVFLVAGCGAGARSRGTQIVTSEGAADRAAIGDGTVRAGSTTRRNGMAVAGIPAESFRAGCAGLVPESPTVTVTLPEALPLVSVVVAGTEDTVLVVRDSAGHVVCNDDGDGFPSPALAGAFAAGTLEIRVGVFRADLPPSPVSITVGTTEPPGPTAITRFDTGCGQSVADYGVLGVGWNVRLGAHREVGGERSWDLEMWNWVGDAAEITELAGLDAAGCPTVRVDSDGGRFAWRIRDVWGVGVPDGPSATPIAGVPLDCGMYVPSYGPIVPGTSVVLGPHGGWTGADGRGGYVEDDAYWNDAMWTWVGERTTVTGLVGVDPSGCPIVVVAADDGQYAWRIRSFSDGGPPDPSVAVVTPWSAMPQQCGMTMPDYGGLRVGASVVLGVHSPWNGPDGRGRWVEWDRWWDAAMMMYVGQRTEIVELGGLDPAGCPWVHVAADGGAWGWRIRDLQP